MQISLVCCSSHRVWFNLRLQEAAAWSKVERIKEDHEQRIAQLEQQQATVELKARLIAHHAPMVDQAMLAVRQALAAGMDWNALVALIREERRQGNPVAAWIRELKLAENKISLAIPNSLPEEEGDYEESDDSDDDDSDEDDDEEDDEEDEEDEDDVDVDVKTLNKKQRRAKAQADHAKSKGKAASGAAKVKPPFVNVDVDLSLTAMKNSEACFSVKKRSADKQQRTAAATSKALKHAEITTRKTLASLEKQQRIAKLRKVRSCLDQRHCIFIDGCSISIRFEFCSISSAPFPVLRRYTGLRNFTGSSPARTFSSSVARMRSKTRRSSNVT